VTAGAARRRRANPFVSTAPGHPLDGQWHLVELDNEGLGTERACASSGSMGGPPRCAQVSTGAPAGADRQPRRTVLQRHRVHRRDRLRRCSVSRFRHASKVSLEAAVSQPGWLIGACVPLRVWLRDSAGAAGAGAVRDADRSQPRHQRLVLLRPRVHSTGTSIHLRRGRARAPDLVISRPLPPRNCSTPRTSIFLRGPSLSLVFLTTIPTPMQASATEVQLPTEFNSRRRQPAQRDRGARLQPNGGEPAVRSGAAAVASAICVASRLR